MSGQGRPVTRLLLRYAVLFTLLLFLPLLLIRAQPYDDSALRVFLLPGEGCSAPCFMGIRPGITGADPALRLLNAHPWVSGNVREVNLPGRGSCLSWDWSEQRPRWVDHTRGDPCIRVQDGYVVQIFVPTRVRYGDLLLALGDPERYTMGRELRPRRGLLHRSLYYPSMAGRVWFLMPCPVEALAFWTAQAEIEIFPASPFNAATQDLPLWWQFCYA